jgi:4-amino-4-deoxy-L-arabinose transferase
LRLFGHNEAAVRIPPLLFGLLGMVTVALLGRALFGESAGLIAGMAYATMLLPMGVSQVAVHDIGLVPFLCIAALCLHRVAADSAPVAGSGIIAGIALGLSILTKGLVGVVFAGILAACLAAGRPSALARLAVVLTIAVVVAAIVAAPWYIAMERAHSGYLHYYFVERHLQGYLTSTQRHGGRPFWYYLPIVIGGALPWTGYLPGAARSAWGAAASASSTTSREHALRLVLWGWFAIGLVFLSIGESKLVTYALPLFPALAIVIGEYVDRVRLGPSREDPLFRMAFMAHVATLAFLPAIGLALLKVKFDDMRPLLWVAVALLAVAIVAAARRAIRPASTNALVDGIVGMSVLATIGLMIVTRARPSG